MAADDYIVHVHQSPIFDGDTLTIWHPNAGRGLPVLQIDQADGVTAYMKYRPEDARAIAAAVLAAAGVHDVK